MSGHVNYSMDKGSIMDSEDRIEKVVDIYVSAEAVRDMKHKKEKEDFDTQTTKTQAPQHTGSDLVKNRNFRAAAVCLVLLCVLLLTAVIVLCVTLIQERQQLISKNENPISERDQLRSQLQICVGWTCFQSSLYYMPNETKNWTESRRYCTDRGADLITTNNREEHDFIKNISGAAAVWIGLTDSDEESKWKWVDGSTLTSGFWAFSEKIKEPNGGRAENCAVTVAVPQPVFANLVGWHDVACNKTYQWICEKRISPFIMS